MEEENDGKKKEKTAKEKAFLQTLRDHQIAQARGALVKTLCENSDQTIGAILDLLEEDEDGDYIMVDVFKRTTIYELVELASAILFPDQAASAKPGAFTSSDDDDADAFDDDGLFDDDGFLEEEDDDDEPAKPRKKKKKNKKKKNKDKKEKKDKKKGKKKKDKDGEKKAPKKKPSKSESAGGGGEAVSEKAILGCLRSSKARNEESAISSKAIRDQIGGDAALLRGLLDELFQAGKVDKCGKARGTKYFLA